MKQARVADEWALAELASLERAGLRRELWTLDSPQGAHVQVDGEELVNFCSNDYLGLANDPRLAAAATEALVSWGLGTGASRLVAGDTRLHQALEDRLAAFMGSDAALVFNSGYAANTGVLQTLCGPGDVVFSDSLNHASLIDGCRLSRARIVVYPHCDVDALDRLLRENPGRRQVVVTDSVFSMDGDCAPLERIVAVARSHGAALYVDEAHALGVLGPRGQGLCTQLGLESQVDVRMGTFGKALGGYGAFVACSRPVADWLLNRARPFVFSTSLPPALCAAAIEAVGLVEQDDSLRRKLWGHIDRLAQALGLERHETAVFSVVLGTPQRALEASERLRERGLLVRAIRPPTVPEGTSRLRITLSAAHSTEDVERLVAALRELGIPNEQ